MVDRYSLKIKQNFVVLGSRAGTVVRALVSHQCGPGSIPRSKDIIMWVEFVGSLLCSERFFPGYSGFPLSAENQYDLISFAHDPSSYSALNVIM